MIGESLNVFCRWRLQPRFLVCQHRFFLQAQRKSRLPSAALMSRRILLHRALFRLLPTLRLSPLRKQTPPNRPVRATLACHCRHHQPPWQLHRLVVTLPHLRVGPCHVRRPSNRPTLSLVTTAPRSAHSHTERAPLPRASRPSPPPHRTASTSPSSRHATMLDSMRKVPSSSNGRNLNLSSWSHSFFILICLYGVLYSFSISITLHLTSLYCISFAASCKTPIP